MPDGLGFGNSLLPPTKPPKGVKPLARRNPKIKDYLVSPQGAAGGGDVMAQPRPQFDRGPQPSVDTMRGPPPTIERQPDFDSETFSVKSASTALESGDISMDQPRSDFKKQLGRLAKRASTAARTGTRGLGLFGGLLDLGGMISSAQSVTREGGQFTDRLGKFAEEMTLMPSFSSGRRETDAERRARLSI